MMRLFLASFFLLLSIDVSATSFMRMTEDQRLRMIVPESNAIFVGKVIGRKIIKNGYLSDGLVEFVKVENGINIANGSRYEQEDFDIGIWEIEVEKVYRGNLKTGAHETICSFIVYPSHIYSITEMIYTKIGESYTFFGVKSGGHIYQKSHLGWLSQPNGHENKIKKYLSTPTHIDMNGAAKQGFDYDADVLRNACLEDDPK